MTRRMLWIAICGLAGLGLAAEITCGTLLAGKSRPPALTRHFSPATWKSEVDLRPRFFELGLYTKNQGRRPSCSVFAILGVLEFHYSLRKEAPVFLSEEFLVWATSQINPRQTDADGFSFGEVLAAIRRHGLVARDSVPDTFEGPLQESVAIQAIQAVAFGQEDFAITRVVGSNKEKLAAIMRELNEGYPVAIALAWPPDGVMARVHTLRDQKPREGAGHAVTLVGYHEPEGPEGERLFLFRNSYGPHWGVAGHGYVSESYLEKHLRDVVGARLASGSL